MTTYRTTTVTPHSLIAERRSPRAFDPSRPVDDAAVFALLEAARWAPSAFNAQPWRFIVGRKGDETYGRILDTLMDSNRIWAQNAPLLILAVAQERGEHGEMRYAWHDMGLATAQLMLQAVALGLFTHVMAGFSKDAARAAFAIPDDFSPVTVIAAGYLGDAADLPEALREREDAPRSRRPLSETAFREVWGRPLEG
ncbi:MAG: nitroreductase family protein [Anaerolineales bacterium]